MRRQFIAFFTVLFWLMLSPASAAERGALVSGSFARDVMLDGRNAALADKLAQLLANEANTVAGIGVLHLVGRNSVPALLRARAESRWNGCIEKRWCP